jgi:transposase-like protein
MRQDAAAAATGASEWRPPAKRRWSEADGRSMARAFAQSGETEAAFATRHGLDEERVRRWLRAQEATAAKRDTVPAFVPVRVLENRVERRGGVEIVVGNCVVRVAAGFCPDLLRQVIAALEANAC